jgi:4-hydroxyphenylpyruvate dioxygenase
MFNARQVVWRLKMQTAIATVCLSGVLNEKLEAIAAAGFKGVEMFENDLLSFNGTPADVRRMIEDLGLRTITFQPFRDFEGMPEDRRARVFQRAERKFDLMQELGCDLLMICSNVSPESLGGIDRSAADLHEIGERAAKRGLRVGFEALAWGRHINDYRDAWEAVRCADHPAIGVVLDSFHILARKTDLGAIRSIPRDRVFLVQIADAPCSKWTTYPGVATTAISRARRTAVAGVHAGAPCDRLRWAAFTGDLQRPVPGRVGAQPCDRRTPLAYLSA